jgi:hypothetical protein
MILRNSEIFQEKEIQFFHFQKRLYNIDRSPENPNSLVAVMYTF